MNEQLEQSEMDVKSEIIEYLGELNISQLETVRDAVECLYEANLAVTASL